MPDKDLIAASSAPILLSILCRGESYGYEIIRAVREQSGGALEWAEGMLYPVLHRLEKAGYIRSEWRTAETGRERRYYTITRGGRKELARLREEWQTVHACLTRLWEVPNV